MYRGTPIRLYQQVFLAETLEAQRDWHNIFKVLKEKNFQTRILYLAKLSVRIGGKIKSFSNK